MERRMLVGLCGLAAWLIGLVAGAIADDAAPSADLRHGPLKVSSDGRHLVHADGTPFFYLGDTAWELFHRLNREEADLYLRDRAKKGFTVIQAVVLAELDGLNTPNAYGHTPLEDNDPTRFDEAYFEHVDFVVARAAELGLHIGMLPTWGDKWNKKWGVGPVIFNPENAEAYGELLGRRYRQSPVIWILGGDRSPENAEHLAVIRAMARGLARGDGGSHLMTFHPQGGANSAQWFHGDSWLALNMIQSGHAAPNIPNYQPLLRNRELQPAKPTLDGEPRYEDHPINWKSQNGWFDEADVRQAAYWALLAGTCGHTYGDHNIWQMWQPGRNPISQARTPWKEALGHPGSTQVGYARQLLESLPWQSLEPDPELLAEGPLSGAEHLQAAKTPDGQCALVYTPTGRTLALRLDRLAAPLRARWFDPRQGRYREVPAQSPFDPPGEPGRGNDWVLVLQRR